MTKGVASPRMIVFLRTHATTRAVIQEPMVIQKRTVAAEPLKKAPPRRRKTGTFAPQGMNGAVRRVASFSLGLLRVRAPMTPGTAQPPGMPPATMKGMTEHP
jgi:hypothetical protein